MNGNNPVPAGNPVDASPQTAPAARASSPGTFSAAGYSFWTAERDDELRRLWLSGMSTVAIGREMGKSKDAIVGRAHRLQLPARSSPIKNHQQIDVERAKALRADGLTYAEIGNALGCSDDTVRYYISDRTTKVYRVGTKRAGQFRNAIRTLRTVATNPVPLDDETEAAPAERPILPAVKFGPVTACAFPHDPGIDVCGKRYRYCDEPTMPGSSYCPEHHAICWRVPEKRRRVPSDDANRVPQFRAEQMRIFG